LEHSLAARKVQRLTVIVGYQSERFAQILGSSVDGMAIDYARNGQYQTTEHGYSVYCAREAWRECEMPVLFMDADNAFTASLLDRLLAAPHADCVLVDPMLRGVSQDEELVLGSNGMVTDFVRGRGTSFDNCVGGFVGMNRFSKHYMGELFDFMDTLFAKPVAPTNLGLKYERIFNRLAHERGIKPRYLDTGGLDWININRPDDLTRAIAMLRTRA
jgi:choline kinase